LASFCTADINGRTFREPHVTYKNCSAEEMNFIDNHINNNERYYNPKLRNFGLDVKESLPYIRTGTAIGSLALTAIL